MLTFAAATTTAAHGRHGGFFLLILLLVVVIIIVVVALRRGGGRKARHRDDDWGRHAGRPDAGPPGTAVAPPAPGVADVASPGGPPPPEPSRADPAEPVGGRPAAPSGPGAVFEPAATPAAWRPPDAGRGWAVETHGLTKRFGTTVAVNDVELLVPRGSAFGCLGPNGAGKTTLIRTLLGLTRADGGTMSLLGVPVPRERSRALARVGAIVDEPRFHDHLTGRQNLLLLAAARGAGAEDRIGSGLARVGLTDRADDKVGSYSMGMRQRLGVAACLLGDPELLILDEPMNGLDPAGIQSMRMMIQSLVAEGRTVMLSSHLLDEVERTCDAVAIVDRGRVIRQGPIEELLHGTTSVVVQVDCDDPAKAAGVIGAANLALDVAAGRTGLTVTLRAGANREAVAELNRRLVEVGISVYGLQEVRTSLEDWFLSVTSRFGEQA